MKTSLNLISTTNYGISIDKPRQNGQHAAYFRVNFVVDRGVPFFGMKD